MRCRCRGKSGRAREGLHRELLVNAEHDRLVARIEVAAHAVSNLLGSWGSAKNRRTTVRCGCRPNARQMRLTADCVKPHLPWPCCGYSH